MIITVAKPIKEPPILYGEDARRLRDTMKNPIKETPEEMQAIKRDYEYIMSIFEKGNKKHGSQLQS